MPNGEREYEMRERAEFQRQIRAAERGTLRERKESCARFFEAMRDDPALVGERVGWLLDGSYGYGAHQAAREVIRNRRMNRAAWLTRAIGAVEWMCPGDMFVRAWKKLSSDQKARLQREVERAMSEALAEGSNGRDRGRCRVRSRSATRTPSRGRDSVREQAKKRAKYIKETVGRSRGLTTRSRRSRSRPLLLGG